MSRLALADDRVYEVMAFDRKTFKNKLLAILSGAITHFYMVQLAERNGKSKWVQHWKTEIDRLLNLDFVVVLVSETKGRWDKKKAVSETIADLATVDRRYRTVAANYVTKVYRLNKLDRHLPAELQDQFRSMIWEAVERGLEER